MQNKGAIRLFAILLALVCVYQLYFTYKVKKVEKAAKGYAAQKAGNLEEGTEEYINTVKKEEDYYLDSISSQVVYSFLGMRDYTYRELKGYEMNLGLDLKGGMNVTLEVSVVGLIRSMSNYSKDPAFNEAIKLAAEQQKGSQEDFITLFGRAFEEVAPGARLAAIFNTIELRDRVNFNSTNEDVIKIIREETDNAIDNSFNVIRTRIDRFGVAQPNIQKLQAKGRILVELPGVSDASRVRKLLQGTAKLEFWETWENSEVYSYLLQANEWLREIQEAVEEEETEEVAEAIVEEEEEEEEEGPKDDALDLLSELEQGEDSLAAETPEDIAKNFPLFSVLQPNTSREGQLFPGPVIGIAHFKDTSKVNTYMNMGRKKSIFPKNMIFRWSAKAIDEGENFYQLIALKVTSRDGRAPLDGDVVTDARQGFGDNRAESVVNMRMNSDGAKVWARMTRENVGRSVAIVLDDYVQSYPTVQGEIPTGSTQISGKFSVNEAKDLANMLKSGKMPAPAVIVSEDIVGPTLGKESIESGLWSFAIAFVLILLYMLFFYSFRAGTVANIALITNLFFIIGVLASLGAVLTLPGIAGIVLTIGMSVDANVLIYERVQEEIKAGKGLRLAIKDGYQNAYSAIIDGQLTTLFTGIVLYVFGSGPIKGFATTLIIGILTSLFCAIFITRLVFERWLDKEKKITYVTSFTAEWLRKSTIMFLEKRKIAYVVSGILIAVSILVLSFKGLNYSIDFKGGRTYVVRLTQAVKVADVAKALSGEFGSMPEVKTFGGSNQVRITTGYRIDEDGSDVDADIESKLYAGMNSFIGEDISLEKFLSDYRMSSQKVGPTISADIRRDAIISIFFALLIIFLYILARFRTWQYGLGAVAALAHDSIIVLGLFAMLDGYLPFSLEADQAFIAAILTVLGYSINDTVVVFDRIREYLKLHPKQDRTKVTDSALNSTLRRTFSTSLSTLIVLLAIFIFGGTSIKGFVFALLIGVVIGTYSSLFIASPIAFDTVDKSKVDKSNKFVSKSNKR